MDSTKETESEKKVRPSVSRRNLIAGIGASCALVGLGAVNLAGKKELLRPPGAQDENKLLALCIRCGKCIEICPNKIIRPAHLEDGFIGMRTPILNFSENWCDWCESAGEGKPLCAETCPTGAICLDEGATMENTIIGKAVLDKDHCLAYRNTGCRFCYDACDLEAIVVDVNMRPSVVPDLCNGCGACESVCVSLEVGSVGDQIDKRAIVIVPVSEFEE